MEKHVYTPVHPDEEGSEHLAQALKTAKRWRSYFFTVLGLFIVALLIIGGFVFCELELVKSKFRHDVATDMPYSPAAEQVEYVDKWLSRDPETHRFVGKPRPELDDAWHELLEGTLIRISGEELLMADNATSIRHKDGGYVAGLGISHSLHCLKRLKQYMYPEYYYTSPDQDWEELEHHADHCLESLRQSIMCQADLSVYTLEWTPHSQFKPAVRVPQPHTCVNWDRIHSWMKGRLAKNEDMEPPPSEMFEKSDDA